MAIERSLILLKPDCLDGNHAGEVIGRFEKAGFEIRATKLIALTDELLQEHYAHIADRPGQVRVGRSGRRAGRPVRGDPAGYLA